MRVTIRELKETVREVVKQHEVREAKKLIEGILAEKGGMFDKIAGALGRSNPSRDVDDPKKAKSKIDGAISGATKKGAAFKKDALADTKKVNDYHDAVKSVIDAVTALGDSLPEGEAAEAEKELIKVVKGFYGNLRQEADRLDSYMKTVSKDVGAAGFDKRMPYLDTKGLKKSDKNKPQAPGGDSTVLIDDEEGLTKMLGTKPTWEKEKETPDVDSYEKKNFPKKK